MKSYNVKIKEYSQLGTTEDYDIVEESKLKEYVYDKMQFHYILNYTKWFKKICEECEKLETSAQACEYIWSKICDRIIHGKMKRLTIECDEATITIRKL